MKVNKHDISDFDYLAEQGFASVNISIKDEKDLSRQIRWRIIKNYLFKVFFVASLMAIPVVCYVLKDTPQLTDKSILPVKTNAIETPKSINKFMLDTSLKLENLNQNSEPITKASVQLNNHEAQTFFKDTLEPMILERKVIHLNSTTNTLQPKTGKTINSPVTYIHQLKVSNYHSLYFNRKHGPSLKSLTSNFEDWQSKNILNKQIHEVPIEFLHEKFQYALWYFKKKDFTKSTQLFVEILELTKEDENCFFYLGMNYFHTSNYDKAIAYFDKCITHNKNTFAQESLYYKALALIENNSKEEAVVLLNEIVVANDFYSKNAKLILSKIN